MFSISLSNVTCCITRTMPAKPRMKWRPQTVVINSQTKSIIQASKRSLWSECKGQ